MRTGALATLRGWVGETGSFRSRGAPSEAGRATCSGSGGCRPLTADGVEGGLGVPLEALAQLQRVLLLVQQRVRRAVHGPVNKPGGRSCRCRNAPRFSFRPRAGVQPGKRSVSGEGGQATEDGKPHRSRRNRPPDEGRRRQCVDQAGCP